MAGALAQLVERFHGMEKVNGSTPLCSTNLVFTRSNQRALLIRFRVILLPFSIPGQ